MYVLLVFCVLSFRFFCCSWL